MRSRGIERLAPLAGIAFVALVVAAVIIGGETPDNGDSPRSIARFWIENDADQMWASAIGAWATAFFVWFAASVRVMLRRAEEGTARLSALSFAGAIIAAGGLLASMSLTFVIADAPDDIAPQVAQTLTILSNGFFFPIAIGFGIFYVATGIATVRTGVLPVWLGWLTIVLGIACMTPVGFFAFLLGAVWIVALSIVLFRRERGSDAEPAAAA